jgi:4-diphosphocytidyl-2-C-methyl-D-erythritol kinase
LPPIRDGAALVETAWAKLNLYLHVTAIRDDGYHELDSLFVFADIGDTLAVEPAAALVLDVDGPFAPAVPDGADNLVMRAARALGAGRGARIRLTKRLPVASGIGGGSADAAAALRALDALWELRLPAAALERIAGGLGADVPACVRSVPTQVSGIGEILAEAPPPPPCWVVLANPGAAVSTPAVFRAFDAALASFSPAAPLGPHAGLAGFVAALAERANDLQPAAIAIAPAIGDVLVALAACDGCLLARMSGSGATCFGLFGDPGTAERAAQNLRGDHALWWVAWGKLRAGGA